MAKSENYRDRLEALNRGPLRNRDEIKAEAAEVRRKLRKQRRGRTEKPAASIVYHRDSPQSQTRPPRVHLPVGEPVALEAVVKGVEVPAPLGGLAFVIEQRVAELEKRTARLSCTFLEKLAGERSQLRRRLCAAAETRDVGPEDVIFLDLETCGLSSAPLFLIGTMVCEAEELVVRQYFARDYSEERAVTSLFMDAACGKRVLVSFNGKSFDLPYVRARAAANAVACAVPPVHFDLLHECRRVWRNVLPNCKLQTLESAICGRTRTSDIPGSEIPEAYHAFVRTQNAAQISQILKHNLLDLVTLADLMVRLPR